MPAWSFKSFSSFFLQGCCFWPSAAHWSLLWSFRLLDLELVLALEPGKVRFGGWILRHVPLASPHWGCVPPAPCRLLPARWKGILGMQCLPWDPLTQHCHGLPPTRDARVLPTFCSSPAFKLLPLPSLEGARSLLQGLGSPGRRDVPSLMPGEDRELPLGWEEDSSQRAFLRLPFAFPSTLCSLHGSPLPSGHEALFQPEGTEAARGISLRWHPSPAARRCGRAGLCSGMRPPQPIPAPTPLPPCWSSALFPTARAWPL